MFIFKIRLDHNNNKLRFDIQTFASTIIAKEMTAFLGLLLTTLYIMV